jgi:apolipoprotein N-acyltransferase
LALIGAALLWAAFFPGFGFLAWFALIPFFLSLKGAGPKRGAILGFLFGFVFFVLEFSSLGSLQPFIGPMAYGVIFLLALYGGVFLTVFGALAGWQSSPVFVAAAWALLEAARGSGPLGFTFGTVPAALAGTPFSAAAGLAGPWLLSLTVALTAAFFAHNLRKPKILPIALLFPLLLWGIGEALPEPKSNGTVRLALIQPDISQAERLDRGKLPEILARYERLLKKVPTDVDLIVIPENATPAFLRIEREYLEPFARAAQEKGVPLMIGTADIEGGKVRNTMLLLTPDGRESVVYAKMHLVPFGEYVPGRKIWERLGLAAVIDQFLPYDQSPGERLEPVGIYGVVICFESAFPGPTRCLRGKAQSFCSFPPMTPGLAGPASSGSTMPWGPLGPRKRAASVFRWGKPGSAALGILKGEKSGDSRWAKEFSSRKSRAFPAGLPMDLWVTCPFSSLLGEWAYWAWG